MTRHDSLTDKFSRHQIGASTPCDLPTVTLENPAITENDIEKPPCVELPVTSLYSATALSVLPGQKLVKARKAQGLSLEQVAESLYLTKSYVTAIEQDNYEQLPNGAFVVGYLRAYSKLLKLNSDEIVSVYKESLALAEEVEAVDTFSLRPVAVFRPIAAALSGIVLLVVVSVAWTGDGSQGNNAIEMVEVEVEDAQGNVVLESLASREEASQYAPQQNSAMQSPFLTASTVDDVANLPLYQVSQLSLDNPLAGEVAFELYQDNARVLDGLDHLESPVAFTKGGDNSVLNIQFSRECWLEVVDGNGEKIFADLKSAGSVLKLSGVPPLQVKLGNWRAVASIDFDAKSIAIPQPENRDVVQLALAPQDY